MDRETLISFRTAIAGLTAIIALAVITVAQTPAPTGKSTIRGRAIYEDTERPVRRARVVLFTLDEPSYPSRTVVTDGRGEFTFRNLASGQYQVLADYPGYVNGFPTIDLKRRKPVPVSVDGTADSQILLRTERGGSITGKITYPDGEPAVGAQINVLIKQGKQWSHAPIVSSGAQTDDRGVYRIYPLPPGEYVVSVIEQSLVIEERGGGQMQTTGNKSLTPYYYGDSSDYKTAKIIQVDSGREVTNINLTLTERATYKIAGTITASGEPLAGAYLRLAPHNEGLGGPTLMIPQGLPTRSDKDGRWSFMDVPDGRYAIELDHNSEQYRIQSPDSDPNKTRPKFVPRRLDVTVAGADVSDLVMPLSEGGKISGSITVEGDKPLPRTTIDVSSEMSGDSSGYGTSGRVEPAAKGMFMLEAVAPGDHLLTARTWDGKYFVKSITWDGRDLMRQPLKVEELGEIKGVRIILSDEMGTLSGQLVSGEPKKPLVRTFFLLAPVEEARWTRRDAIIFGRTDGQGAFKLSGAPGEYILCVQAVGEKRPTLMEYLKAACVSAAPRVTLKRGEQNKLEFVVPIQTEQTSH